MSEPGDKVTISDKGIRNTLSYGGTVDGFLTDQGDFAWLFTRGEVKTPLRLSDEAMSAVVRIYADLKSGAHRDQEPPGARRWVLVADTTEEQP